MDIPQCMKEHKIDMKEFESFLESSSISGLNHISNTRRYGRLFWVFIVLTGFTVSGFLIYESFQSWKESPVKTTIETLPITELIFPKVTVCPPKNTFTNLNYDLMMLENMTLDDDIRIELTEYALELLHNNLYDNTMKNLSKIYEHRRYYNWYYGYQGVVLPYYSYQFDTHNFFKVFTTAVSGSIKTQYFMEEFSSQNIESELSCNMYFEVPDIYRDNINITFHLRIEKNSMKDLSSGHDKFTYSSIVAYNSEQIELDEDMNNFERNLSPPSNFLRFETDRKVAKEDIENLEMKLMPGFKVSWFYTNSSGQIEDPVPKPRRDTANKMFVRFVTKILF